VKGRGSRQNLEGSLRRKTAPAPPTPNPTRPLRVYVVAVLVFILAIISGGLGAETQNPPLYELLPFNYPYPLIRVCRTDYGICLIPVGVAPGTPCECRAADGSWFPGVCIH
jgi:hypothetical protein